MFFVFAISNNVAGTFLYIFVNLFLYICKINSWNWNCWVNGLWIENFGKDHLIDLQRSCINLHFYLLAKLGFRKHLIFLLVKNCFPVIYITWVCHLFKVFISHLYFFPYELPVSIFCSFSTGLFAFSFLIVRTFYVVFLS